MIRVNSDYNLQDLKRYGFGEVKDTKGVYEYVFEDDKNIGEFCILVNARDYHNREVLIYNKYKPLNGANLIALMPDVVFELIKDEVFELVIPMTKKEIETELGYKIIYGG